MADSEDCRLDLIDSHKLGIRAIVGECRPGLVAVQGALASAPERNWTNLALFIARTPPFGDDVDSFPPEVQKFAEQNGWAGETDNLGFLLCKLQLVHSLSGDALRKSPLRTDLCSDETSRMFVNDRFCSEIRWGDLHLPFLSFTNRSHIHRSC
jgi:hypothetical protein